MKTISKRLSSPADGMDTSVLDDAHACPIPHVPTATARCPVTSNHVKHEIAPRRASQATLEAEAQEFLLAYGSEQGVDVSQRLREVERAIAESWHYTHTTHELEFAARVAWRNSVRCIGRLYWKTLQVRDLRHLSSADQVFEACVEHLQIATNGGRVRPLMSIFAPATPGSPGVRIWNPQLIRYAGYEQPDGTVLGDPGNVELTRVLTAHGWQGGEGGGFDILPLAIQAPGEPVRLFELPREAVLEVPISHPQFGWFEDLALRWHAVPAISNMRFEVGGISFPAAPFNGWYMGTEIGARNFGDDQRYNVLPEVARRMGLDTSSDKTLWRDRAIVELNVAVLHSFRQARVTIIDHHAAAKHFIRHIALEENAGRETHADWSWIVPPISGSTTPVFHRYYPTGQSSPNFYEQPPAWTDARQITPV
jgi:nitric-oxide synthase, bacterial